eukprot:gene18415-biopygen2416
MWPVRRRRRRPEGGGIEIVRRRRRRTYGENGEIAAPQAPPLDDIITARREKQLRPRPVCVRTASVLFKFCRTDRVRITLGARPMPFLPGAALARRSKVAHNNIRRREPGKGQRFGGPLLWRTKNSHHIIHPGSE